MAGATGLEPATSGVTGRKPPVDNGNNANILHTSEIPRCTECCTPDPEIGPENSPETPPATGPESDPVTALARVIAGLDPEAQQRLAEMLAGDTKESHS